MGLSRALGLAPLLVAIAACSHRSAAKLHETIVENVQGEDVLVRRWEGAPGETFLITQQGPVFTKWRVYDWVVTESVSFDPEALAELDEPICLHAVYVLQVGDRGTTSEVLGRVDTQRELCFADDDPIDCDQLREDPNLAEYITWLDD